MLASQNTAGGYAGGAKSLKSNATGAIILTAPESGKPRGRPMTILAGDTKAPARPTTDRQR